MPSGPTDEQVVRYLLNELDDGERRAVQQSLFEDPAAFERVEDAENDLIDALVRGELTAEEARKVRAFVAASGQEHRLNFARALANSEGPPAGGLAAPTTTFESRVIVLLAAASRLFSGRTILAFVCGALAVAGGLLWMENQNLRNAAAHPEVQVAAPSGGIFSFAVPAGAVRGAESVRRVTVPANAAVVEIQLPLSQPNSYTDYAVTVKTVSGVFVWSQTGTLARDADRVRVLMPARALRPASYEVALSGGYASGRREIVNYYYFDVG
jgi:hypothetical protein